MNQPPNRRILLIDDTPSIHDDFRKILMPAVESNQVLDDMESALFGNTAKAQAFLAAIRAVQFECLDLRFGGVAKQCRLHLIQRFG